MTSGKVYLVGAGPGKPDLITIRGRDILREADTVIYDYLVDKRLLKYAGESAELVCASKLGKKRRSDTALNGQDRINVLMIKKALEGKRVARLKNGDPSIFSRCAEEMKALSREGIEFEIVPGVTAANTAACLSGIPLTGRGLASSCVLVSGRESKEKKGGPLNWSGIAKAGTVVLYMAVGNLKNAVNKLIAAGKDKNTPVALIKDAGSDTQKRITGTLRDIAAKADKEKITPPAVMIAGKTAGLEKKFNWLEKNRRILFTGLSKERFFTKGTYFHLPLIRIDRLTDYSEFDRHLKNIEKFDWIVFASRYAAEYFFKRLEAAGRDARDLHGIKIAAVGNSTKSRLLDFGIKADLVPEKESSSGLIEEFSAGGGSALGGAKVALKGKKIFLPRSDLADKNLSGRLNALGAEVTSSCAYRNVMPEDLPDLDLKRFNEIMFTSPSTVRNFKKRYKRIPKGVAVRCIGEVTLKEAKRCRLSG